ncbi:MAG: hypothetical protein IJE93_02190 [Clostridia bacterium]|nr:hypothetical protein [Clostridia bacterium]
MIAVLSGSLLIGVVQFVLLYFGIKTLIGKDYLKTAACVFVKAMLYLAAALVLIFLFKEYMLYAAVGYGAGYFPALIFYFIKTLLNKDVKEDKED